ncbi:accessory gland protein Acp29AB [Drosophila teissieri]|uniref:accessory gland protein Acp29AB n=1 Tax=Drosophila teissieri TaxID=7243 RepID=UPI001CBA477E|nr:accessory gland protein Acp29AB [Drosophila teissieri]
MLKYYLSCALLAWTSWEVLANKTSTPQSRTASANPLLIDQVALYQQQWFAYNAVKENELQEKVARIERTIEGRLMVLQKKMNLTVHDLQATLEKQREDTLEKLRISRRIIPEKFKKIGNRWYFFENNEQNWFSAFNTCRRKGGHLATIYNGKELDEVFAHALPGAYWIDINSAYSKGQYTSTLTGREPPYFRWNNKKKSEKIGYNKCVTVYTRKMFTEDCYSKYFFLCQAEQWEL